MRGRTFALPASRASPHRAVLLVRRMSTEGIVSRTRMIQTEINVHKQEIAQLNYKVKDQQEKIKDNREKIKLNKQLPYLVANVVEVCLLPPPRPGSRSRLP